MSNSWTSKHIATTALPVRGGVEFCEYPLTCVGESCFEKKTLVEQNVTCTVYVVYKYWKQIT